MSIASQILPGTGRGTTRWVVEGHARSLASLDIMLDRTCPSTMLRMVPLLLQGRIA